RWHPTELKVAIFDIGGFVVLDLTTGNIQSYELSTTTPMWAVDAEWSPDGKKMALGLVKDDPFYSKMELGVLDMASGAIQLISVPLTLITDLAWAPNSRQVIAAGHQRTGQDTYLSNLFLAD